MAYEFKKLSNVEVLDTTTEATKILVEENGEIVKTSPNNFKTGLLKTNSSATPNEDGTITSAATRKFNIIDGSEFGVPLNNYNQFTAKDLIDSFRAGYLDTVFCRSVMKKSGGAEDVLCTSHCLPSGSNVATCYFGNNLAPIIVDGDNNTFTLDSDWVAPAEPIPAPPVAEVGQVVAVKAVDENGKPTEWEAVDMAAGGSNGKPIIVSVTDMSGSTGKTSFTANQIFEGVMNGQSFILECNSMNYHLATAESWHAVFIQFVVNSSSSDGLIRTAEIDDSGNVTIKAWQIYQKS